MATQSLLSDHARRAIVSFIDTTERLDVLLHVRGLRGRSASPEEVARASGIATAGAEWHLAYLCSCGFLSVAIGTELRYAYRPLTETIRTVVEELDRLNAHRRDELVEAIRTAQSRRAFIAEDDADMRELLRGALEARGFRVVTVTTGKEALARAAGDVFALAIVDLRASRSAGLALLRLLRARHADLPLIVTTALRDARLEAELAGLLVSAVLEKPFELEDLMRVVDSASPARAECRPPLQSA